MNTIKVFIAGPTNAGKTTLVHTLDKNAKSIEHYYEDGRSTTIGFDLGFVYWDSERNVILTEWDESKEHPSVHKIMLMGSPGQEQFAPVREAVSKGSQGILFVIDSTNLGQIGFAIAIYEEIKAYFKNQEIPMVVLANKQDLENAADADTVKQLLKIGSVKVIETSAIEKYNLEKALLELLNMIAYNKNQSTISIKISEKK